MKSKYGRIILIFLCVFLFSNYILKSQQRYWVFFTDKSEVAFDPYQYFTERAVKKKIKQGLPLNDLTDFPVNSAYVHEIRQNVDSIRYISRWFNAVLVEVKEENLSAMRNLTFVKNIERQKKSLTALANISTRQRFSNKTELGRYKSGVLYNQTAILGASFFQKHKINGKGVRIAIFDGGFPGVDSHSAFEHLRDNNQIIATYDFVKNNEHVYDYNSHGTAVLSCIAGIHNDTLMGLATGAEFLLARTELYFEPYAEEEYWLAAMEWAHKNGADIINSSLGYTHHRYFREEMDGQISLVAKAANLAAKKGILVVNSAGNSGTDNWRFVSTPADADSVLAVGGIDPSTLFHADFSSYGPTSDWRIKPNVSAFGYAITATNTKSSIGLKSGTSFASPLVAGFAACAWQMQPNLSNMDLFYHIQKSASLFPYFDYAHGYGVPTGSYFLNMEKDSVSQRFVFEEKDNVLYVNIIGNYQASDLGYIYYNIQNSDGRLKKYFLLKVFTKTPVILNLEKDIEKGDRINVFYKGYYDMYKI